MRLPAPVLLAHTGITRTDAGTIGSAIYRLQSSRPRHDMIKLWQLWQSALCMAASLMISCLLGFVGFHRAHLRIFPDTEDGGASLAGPRPGHAQLH